MPQQKGFVGKLQQRQQVELHTFARKSMLFAHVISLGFGPQMDQHIVLKNPTTKSFKRWCMSEQNAEMTIILALYSFAKASNCLVCPAYPPDGSYYIVYIVYTLSENQNENLQLRLLFVCRFHQQLQLLQNDYLQCIIVACKRRENNKLRADCKVPILHTLFEQSYGLLQRYKSFYVDSSVITCLYIVESANQI